MKRPGRSSRFWRFWLALALPGALGGVLAVGCSGDEDPVTEDTFCRNKAERECKEVLDRCAVEAAECQNKRFLACKALGGTQKTGTRAFKEANTEACYKRVSAALSKLSISPTEWQDMRDACNRVWEGTGTMAGSNPCQTGYDCQKDFICDKGVCATRKVRPQNEFCSYPGDVCQPLQSCQPVVGGHLQCIDGGSVGDPCSDVARCQASLLCDSGTCAVKRPQQSDCTSDNQCATGLCEPFQGKCLASVIFAPNSPTCVGFLAGNDATLGAPPPVSSDAGVMKSFPDAGSPPILDGATND